MLVNGLIDWTTHFSEKDPRDGLIKVYSMLTGEVVQIVGEDSLVSRIPVELVEITREDGSKVVIQKGIEPTPALLGTKDMKYNRMLADVVCSRVCSGESLMAISKESGMPSYATFKKWIRENKEFEEALEKALQDKADYLTDRALEVAEEMHARERKNMPDVAAAKELADRLWQKAQSDKPGKYSPRMKLPEGNIGGVTIIFDTGIRRPGDPGYNADETEKVKDVTDNVIRIKGENGAS